MVFSLNRILYPTASPKFTESSSAMRRDTVVAAILRGWVQPTVPSIPLPAARQNLGIWVVLPEPVSPEMITTGWSFMAAMMSSLRAVMGRAGS